MTVEFAGSAKDGHMKQGTCEDGALAEMWSKHIAMIRR